MLFILSSIGKKLNLVGWETDSGGGVVASRANNSTLEETLIYGPRDLEGHLGTVIFPLIFYLFVFKKKLLTFSFFRTETITRWNSEEFFRHAFLLPVFQEINIYIITFGHNFYKFIQSPFTRIVFLDS